MVMLLGGGCQNCGYDICDRNLVFHHLDPNTKEIWVSSRAFQYSTGLVLPELIKCVLLCHNCHGEVHEGLVDMEGVKEYNQQVIEQITPLLSMDWSEILDLVPEARVVLASN
jgi:hypothetical protein